MPKMKKLYIQKKIKSADGGLEETEEFKIKARAQLTCSNNRPDVYFATDSEDLPVIVKGPYLKKDEALRVFNIQSVLRLFKGVNTFDVNIKLLLPNMFSNIPLGTRTKIKPNTFYYFVILEDLMGLDEYPTQIKSSKKWDKEKVVDYSFMEKNDFSFGVPSKMTKQQRFNLLIQLSIRVVLEIGDFASRNMLRVKDRVFNLDTENVLVGKQLRIKKSEKELLKRVYNERKNDFKRIVSSWKNINWKLVKIALKLNDVQQFKMNIDNVLNDPIKTVINL